MKEHLHPGARWLFRIGGYFGFGILGIILVVFFWSVIVSLFVTAFMNVVFREVSPLVGLGTFLGGVVFYVAFVIIASEIYARMSYNRWFYEFTDAGLRVERGIIWKRYSTVPYERIQNVDIHRGIIARMLGFSSVIVQTAGYSATPYAEGYLPAVEMHRAEEIRSFLLKKIGARKH